jgi:chaperone required for assembly of F1-ATPase
MSEHRLPKRFYKIAAIEQTEASWTVLLDGRPVRTPAKAAFAVPAKDLATAIAGEWDAQGERVDPATMPLARLANTAIDRVAGREGAVADEIAAYAASDLLCYRAGEPEGLVEAQRRQWDPVLEWTQDVLGARFQLAEGIIHAAQPEDSLKAVRRELDAFDAFALAALHTITTLTGSVLLALAHARGRLGVEETWAAAHVDEDWQISKWGEDAEAKARRTVRRAEMEAAALFLRYLGS